MISDQLRDELLAFRKERDWEHPPYGGPPMPTCCAFAPPRGRSAMARRRSRFGGARPAIAAERREAIAEEIADVAILLTYLAHDLDVDMEEAACLRQVNAPEAAEERRQVPSGEGAGCGDEV